MKKNGNIDIINVFHGEDDRALLDILTTKPEEKMGKLKFRFISEDVALYYETDGTADGTWFLSYNISELSGLVDFFHKNHWLVSWCGLGCNMFLKGIAARDYFNSLVNRDRYQSPSSKEPV